MSFDPFCSQSVTKSKTKHEDVVRDWTQKGGQTIAHQTMFRDDMMTYNELKFLNSLNQAGEHQPMQATQSYNANIDGNSIKTDLFDESITMVKSTIKVLKLD
jgi:hypothetical protein